MREGRGGRRVGIVVGGHVDGLHGRDRPLLRRGDALLQLPHLLGEVRLIAHGGGHAAQQRGDLRAGLGEAEDVVDEEQHVAPFGVAEVLGDGQAGQRDAQSRAGRLVHLPEDHRQLVEYLRFAHLIIEIVALARALADAREDRETARAVVRSVRAISRATHRLSWRCC